MSNATVTSCLLKPRESTIRPRQQCVATSRSTDRRLADNSNKLKNATSSFTFRPKQRTKKRRLCTDVPSFLELRQHRLSVRSHHHGSVLEYDHVCRYSSCSMSVRAIVLQYLYGYRIPVRHVHACSSMYTCTCTTGIIRDCNTTRTRVRIHVYVLECTRTRVRVFNTGILEYRYSTVYSSTTRVPVHCTCTRLEYCTILQYLLSTSNR